MSVEDIDLILPPTPGSLWPIQKTLASEVTDMSEAPFLAEVVEVSQCRGKPVGERCHVPHSCSYRLSVHLLGLFRTHSEGFLTENVFPSLKAGRYDLEVCMVWCGDHDSIYRRVVDYIHIVGGGAQAPEKGMPLIAAVSKELSIDVTDHYKLGLFFYHETRHMVESSHCSETDDRQVYLCLLRQCEFTWIEV